ncbi:hypothetical protein ACWD4J_36805 [Streptomyces sp. NPDC002577]
MHDLIRRLAKWLVLVFSPGPGRHRAGARPAHSAPVWRLDTTHSNAMCLPAHRSPYGIDGPIDGGATALVRPYVVVHEEGSVRQRRLALVHADCRIDLDRHLIGAREVAA